MKYFVWIAPQILFFFIFSCTNKKIPNNLEYVGYSKSDSIIYHLSRLDSKHYIKRYLPPELAYENDTIVFYCKDNSMFYRKLEFRLKSIDDYQIYDIVTGDSLKILTENRRYSYKLKNINLENCKKFTVVFSNHGVKDSHDISFLIDLENAIIVEVSFYNEYTGLKQTIEHLIDY